MDPLLIGIAVLVAAAVAGLSLGVLGRRDRESGSERLDQYRADAANSGPKVETAVLRSDAQGRFSLFNRFFGQMKGADAMTLELERAEVPLRVGEFYMIRYACGLVFFLAPVLLTRSVMGVAIGVGLGVMGLLIPGFYVRMRKRSRMKKIDGQLGEMLTQVSNSLKAGYGLMQALDFTARQMRPPLATELQRTLRDASLGMAAEAAVNALGQRLDSADMDMVITAINIQRSVGGNLAEVLDNVAFTMRERERIRGEISTLTAQQTITGYIIGALPIVVGLGFALLNPDYVKLLFTDSLGRILLMIGVGLEAFGIMVIRRIVAIEV